MGNIEGREISLNHIVVFLFCSLILFGVIYKYLEWKTLNNLLNFIRQTSVTELSLVADNSKYNNEASDRVGDISLPSFSKSSLTEQEVSFDKLISSIKVLKDHEVTYRNTVSDNSKFLSKITKLAPLFFGKNGEFIKQVSDLNKRYYQNEITASENSVLADDFSIDMFQIWKENAIYKDFTAKTVYSNAMDSNLKKYWPDFGIFEKYTKENFKFDNEDQIKEKRPYGYEYLIYFKNFFSSTYNVLKDYVMGDRESASYKISKLQNDSYALNTDFDKLLSEGKDKRLIRTQDTISIVTKLSQLMKQYRSEHLGNYPFLKTPEGWNEDLVQCQIYGIKMSVFKDITGSYPVSSSSGALISELDTVSPSTKLIDDQFDKNVMIVTNDAKQISFTCLDKATDKKYPFIEKK